MNNILPNGLPRFNAGSVTTNINFENQSILIGEYAGKDLKIGANLLSKNLDNTIVGYRAGEYSISLTRSTFVGSEAGLNIRSGSNLIVIGRDYNYGYPVTSYDTVAIGFNNKTFGNAIAVGMDNDNSGSTNVIVGRNNSIQGNYNVSFGHQLQSLGQHNINMGYANIIGNNNKSIVLIGNNNGTIEYASNVIVIGDNNGGIKSDSIMIGNNLKNVEGTDLNIGNIVYKENADLVFDPERVERAWVGYNETDRGLMGDVDSRLFVKHGIHTDKINLGTVSLVSPDTNLINGSNTVYVLPNEPPLTQDRRNLALTVDNANNMIWKQLYSYKNTDELPQGTSNLYYKKDEVFAYIQGNFRNIVRDLVLEAFDTGRFPAISLDKTYNGTSNTMIVDKTYNDDLNVTGTLSVNRLLVNKIEVVSYGGAAEHMFATDNYSSVIQTLTNRIKELEDIVKSIKP